MADPTMTPPDPARERDALLEQMEVYAEGFTKRARQQGHLGYITDTECRDVADKIRSLLALVCTLTVERAAEIRALAPAPADDAGGVA